MQIMQSAWDKMLKQYMKVYQNREKKKAALEEKKKKERIAALKNDDEVHCLSSPFLRFSFSFVSRSLVSFHIDYVLIYFIGSVLDPRQ